MRLSVFLIPILLLASPAAALELRSPIDDVPVTTGTIMEAAKMIVALPAAKNSFVSARILSDAEIAALIPTSSAPGNPGSPAIMQTAKLAIGAAA